MTVRLSVVSTSNKFKSVLTWFLKVEIKFPWFRYIQLKMKDEVKYLPVSGSLDIWYDSDITAPQIGGLHNFNVSSFLGGCNKKILQIIT